MSNPVIYYLKWVVSETVGGFNAGQITYVLLALRVTYVLVALEITFVLLALRVIFVLLAFLFSWLLCFYGSRT